MNKLFFLYLFYASVSLIFSCGNVLMKKPAYRGSGEAKQVKIFDEEKGILIDRIESGTKAIIAFYTLENAMCEIQYWAQDAGKSPTVDKPIVYECKKGTNQLSFNERIENLNKDTLYIFKIIAWPSFSDKSDSSSIEVKESFGGSTAVGGNDELPKGQLRKYIVATTDLPKGILHVKENILSSPYEISKLKQEISTVEYGCKNKSTVTLSSHEKISNQSILKMRNLSNRGFATGSNIVSSNLSDYILLPFSTSYQTEDKWQWNYKYMNVDVSLTRKSPVIFKSAPKLTSSESIFINQPYSNKEVQSLTVDKSKPLVFEWLPSAESYIGYVQVILGHDSLAQNVICNFKVNDKKGEIPITLLSKIPAGTHFLLVRLVENELVEEKQINIVMKSLDWRQAKLKL